MTNDVLVLGFYNKQNLGDEMFKESMPLLFPNHNLKFVDLDTIISTCNFNSKYKAIICGGGDIINDYFQKKILLATNNFKGPIIAFGIGITYPDLIDRGYLDIYDHVFLREMTDVRKVQKRLGSQYAHYLPDLGFSLERPHFIGCDKMNIGVCLAQPLFRSNNMILPVIDFFEYLLSQGHTLTLLKFNSSGEINEDDGYINRFIHAHLAPKYKNIIVDEYGYNTTNMLSIMGSMNFNICTRFHSVVFSAIMGVPFLTIHSSRKVKLLVNELDQNKYAYEIPDNKKISTNDLISKFKKLQKKSSKVSAKLTEKYNNYHFQLNTKQPEIFLSAIEKRQKPKDLIDVNSIEKIYNEIHNHMINNTNYKPNSREKSLTTHDAIETAKLISLSTTGAPGDKYTYGTIKNLMDTPWELKGMIDWIIKDQIEDFEKNGPRLNMTYINQENMRGLHRSGWQFCVEYLKGLQADNGVLLDLYTDRTFHWAQSIMESKGIIPYTSPWIGFVHHALNTEYTDYNVESMINNPLFIKSLPMCRGLITLSHYLKEYLDKNLKNQIPILVLPHPTQFVHRDNCFTMDKFIINNNKMLINVGGWYRNTSSLYRLNIDKVKAKSKHGFALIVKYFSKLQSDVPSYPIKKAILKGKNMDSYFPPNDFVIYGGYDVIGKDDRKYFFKILAKGDWYCNGSIISGEGPYISGQITGLPLNGPCISGNNPIIIINQGPCISGNNPVIPSQGSCVSGNTPIVPTQGSCISGQGSIISGEGPLISGESLAKSNKWVQYTEKFVVENFMLVDKFKLSMDDIPYKFMFTLDSVIDPQNKYVYALQQYFKDIINGTTVVEHLPDDQYDNLLSNNLVFLDLVDCSAANTIIECIVRNTPIVVNRHPAIEEYIGSDYPLFYDNVDDVKDLLTVKKIQAAYNYLKNKDKEFLHIEYFVEALRDSTIYKNLNN